jgi:hypothetical protein
VLTKQCQHYYKLKTGKMSEFKKLVEGEILSESQYYKVEKIAGNKVQLVNGDGNRVVVDNEYVNNSLSSASQHVETKKVTKTELAEVFLQNSRVAMTVMFNKKLDNAKVTDNISTIYSKLSFGMTQADFTKQVKAVVNLKGDERVMVGRHYGNPDVNGRVSFVDMNVDKGNPNRLVDPRTINYLIVNNVKYLIK